MIINVFAIQVDILHGELDFSPAVHVVFLEGDHDVPLEGDHDVPLGGDHDEPLGVDHAAVHVILQGDRAAVHSLDAHVDSGPHDVFGFRVHE